MELTHGGLANRSNNSVFDATSGGHPTIDLATIAANIKYFMDDISKSLRTIDTHGSEVMEFFAFSCRMQNMPSLRYGRLHLAYFTRYAMYMIPTQKYKLSRFVPSLGPHVKAVSAAAAMFANYTFVSLNARVNGGGNAVTNIDERFQARLCGLAHIEATEAFDTIII
ncbi:hypothetical protein HAX54_016963, partial [Datura stramonium]|nr:hypothetical protein [Datura stramonium]